MVAWHEDAVQANKRAEGRKWTGPFRGRQKANCKPSERAAFEIEKASVFRQRPCESTHDSQADLRIDARPNDRSVSANDRVRMAFKTLPGVREQMQDRKSM